MAVRAAMETNRRAAKLKVMFGPILPREQELRVNWLI